MDPVSSNGYSHSQEVPCMGYKTTFSVCVLSSFASFYSTPAVTDFLKQFSNGLKVAILLGSDVFISLRFSLQQSRGSHMHMSVCGK